MWDWDFKQRPTECHLSSNPSMETIRRHSPFDEHAEDPVRHALPTIWVVFKALPARIKEFETDAALSFPLPRAHDACRVIGCQGNTPPLIPIDFGRMNNCVRQHERKLAAPEPCQEFRPGRARRSAGIEQLNRLRRCTPRLTQHDWMPNHGSEKSAIQFHMGTTPSHIGGDTPCLFG